MRVRRTSLVFEPEITDGCPFINLAENHRWMSFFDTCYNLVQAKPIPIKTPLTAVDSL